MLVSLNWIRDFVELPASLSAAELAERFTLVCAEVEGVEAIEVDARGLIAAEIKSLRVVEGDRSLRAATMDVGAGDTVETVTGAPDIKAGDLVVFAPTGASTASTGKIADSTVAGLASSGLIMPGDALGIALAVREAVFLLPDIEAGSELDPALFDDWVIEIDNHSINHRPDLWGHYGMAREFAAIFDSSLREYPATPLGELQDESLPEIPIEIDSPDACPRYSGLMMTGVVSQPGPLWMQLRLGHVGLRPISALVDLTNYIMLELGQPMHAFDGDKVDRIEVCTVNAGTKFTTLDNVERTLPDGALMISSHRKPIALAGIMGGADSEISASTRKVLLESANFHPHTIRKCAGHLGHRTDASTRFEKSLDPANTVLSIQRFVQLAREQFGEFTLASRISDAYPKPLPEISVTVDPEFISRFIGHQVSHDRVVQILTALSFKVADRGDKLAVTVPSFRATRDIEIEVDIIEEVARYVGYNNIEPAYPQVEVRALEPNSLLRIERRALSILVQGLGMTEIYSYLWYDNDWCNRLGYDPADCVRLRNPPAAGQDRMRQSLIPGMLAVVERNRHNFTQLRLTELGSAFVPDGDGVVERRRVAVVLACRRKSVDDEQLAELKGAIDNWSQQVVALPAEFACVQRSAAPPWEHSSRTAGVVIGGRQVGSVSAVPFALRRKIDEHLAAWTIVWAEIDLEPLAELGESVEKIPSIPAFPEVELDFSALTDCGRRYADITQYLGRFDDELLRRVTFVDSYDGKSVPAGKRVLTFRTRIGDGSRTLQEADLVRFREAFQKHLTDGDMELRSS